MHAPYSRIFGVFFNPANNSLYTDEGVRHALSTAIDRPGLVENVLGGYAVPAIGPVPAGYDIPDLAFPDPATRVDRARQYLADAGWKWSDADQSWTKGGQTLSVTLTTSNVPELKALATRIQTDWNAIGVPVTVELTAPADLTQSVIRPRNFSALLFGEVVSSPADLFAFWDSGERKDPGLNIAGYANTQVDALLEDLRSQQDPQKVHDDLAQANALIASDFPAAFTHTPDFLYSIPSDLKGVHLGRVSQPTDRLETARYWYRRTELIWPWFANRR
jgi:peptide/nickel transport system substrate-binding protein